MKGKGPKKSPLSERFSLPYYTCTHMAHYTNPLPPKQSTDYKLDKYAHLLLKCPNGVYPIGYLSGGFLHALWGSLLDD